MSWPSPVQLTPVAPTAQGRPGKWLTGTSEGVIAKEADAPYRPGERKGMVKIKRVRTADCVVAAFRFGKEEGTVGSLILGLYDDAGELHVVGHTSGFTAKQKRELLELLEPYRTHERGSGEPSRWKSDEELVWEGLRPELVCEIAFDHITGNRIRHGAKFLRWREDKEPGECRHRAAALLIGLPLRRRCSALPARRAPSRASVLPDPARQPVRRPGGRRAGDLGARVPQSLPVLVRPRATAASSSATSAATRPPGARRST